MKEVTDSDKHSSLLQYVINSDSKKFYSPGPWLFFETCKESCSGGSSVVEYSSRHPSVKGLSTAVKPYL